MAGDGDASVGAGLPAPADPAGAAAPTGPAAVDQHRDWWAELPDPWDLPDRTGEDGAPRTHRRRRSPRRRWLTGRRRVVAVVAVAGALLVGTGVVAKLVGSGPTGLVAPLPAPGQEAAPPGAVSGFGVAPSPSVGTGTAPPPMSYEAEAAELGGRAETYPVDGASGGSAVRRIGMGDAGFVLFPEVAAARAGEHLLTVYYVDSRRGTARISVNDGQLHTVHFPGLGDATVGEVSLRVDLVAGSNTVWFGHNGNGAPDLDRIVVSQP